ncbi:hypothetical protein RF11_11880 [Thelohanellus kitauei]|uniref:Uncharacterized protein n=1 Tax=Thelohanellus kitauei TaxID=669202 RepID=A0A0C2M155_THEKT|nr:hypothetical protein RF11_11880 [Thelohanellus kitauei]
MSNIVVDLYILDINRVNILKDAESDNLIDNPCSDTNDWVYFYVDNIKQFTSDGSELNIRIEETDESYESSWLAIKCKLQDLGNEIEISKCNISVRRRSNDYYHQIGYKYKINNYTKYKIINHNIWFNISGDGKDHIDFGIREISIIFTDPTETCELEHDHNYIYASFQSTDLVYPCITTRQKSTSLTTTTLEPVTQSGPSKGNLSIHTIIILSIVFALFFFVIPLLIYRKLKPGQRIG